MNYTSWARQTMAFALSVLLVPFAQLSLCAQEPPPGGYAPLDAQQLDQLVAPIALYPDSLVAQVLSAATFPQQVADADNWVHQNGGMPPDQLAAAINGAPWDPSVKALAEFPSVLDNMARNESWTGALGNAYYNQPGDVMNAVQAMRYQAQQAGTLRSNAQERVLYNGGLVVIEPVNPALVYVPYYNPWTVYGAPVPAWGGYYWGGPPRGVVLGAGLAIGFGVGIGIGLFSHFGWGYHAWSPNWHGGVVVYNHNTYISRSTTIVNAGHFGSYNRGVFEREGRGVPGGFHPAVTARTAVFAHPGAAGAYHPGPAAGNAYHPTRENASHAPAASAYHAPAAGAYHPPAAGAYHPANPSHPAPATAYHPAARPGAPANTYHPAAAGHPGAAQTYHAPAAAHAPSAYRPAVQAHQPAPHAEAAHSQPKPREERREK